MLRARREARQNGQQPPGPGGYGGYGGRLAGRRAGYDPYQQQQQQYGAPPQGYGYDGPQGYGGGGYGPPQQQYQQQQYPPPQQQYQQQQYGSPQPQYPPQQYGSPQPQYPQQQQYDPYGPPPAYGEQEDVYAPEPLPRLPDYQSNGPRPCVVPQVGHQRFSDENMSPFVRVRVPEMEQYYGISHHQWIVFLDEFNEAWMANPALQVANQAGNLAGMAPSVIAQIVGVGVNVGASIGSAVTTKVRTKKYLAKANEEIFNPRGVHVQVCKTEKMLEYVGLGGQDHVFSRYKQAFEYTQMNGPMIQGNNNPTLQRMQSLGNRVMPISFDNVEAPTKPDGWMKKWGAHNAQKAEQKQNDKDARHERRAARRPGRGSSRREERNEKKKEKETKKIRWLVIAPKEQVAGKDDDWDSDSEKK